MAPAPVPGRMKLAGMHTTAAAAPPFARRVSALGSENAFRIAPLVREIEQRGERVLKCHVGEPDFALPELRVYSDEVYERIVFDGERHHSIASVPGMADRTIIVSGVSKTYAWTGGRVGWAILPTVEEAEAFRNLNINYFSCVSGASQLGAKLAIESALSEPAIAAMVAEFQHRRDVMVRHLEAIPGVRCASPKGAFYLFPNISGVCERIGAIDAWNALAPAIRDASSPSTLFQRFLLAEHKVATLDRRSFGAIGSEGKHFLRISVATALQDLAEAAFRIAAAAEDREGFRRFMRKVIP